MRCPRPSPGAAVLPNETAPGHLVRVAQQRHTQLWTEEFAGELTGPQYAVVCAVESGDCADQRTVGRLASLDKSSTADIVARLQDQGWLRLARDPADGRRKKVTLTALARRVLPEVTRRVGLVQTRLIDPVPPALREQLLEVMRVVAYAGEVPGPGHPVAALSLSDTPGHLIRRTQQVHTAIWAEEVGRALTAPQYSVLSALWTVSEHPDADGLDQTGAGQLAGLDKSSMADVVERLVRRGWLVRSTNPLDARVRLLRLTSSARDDLPALTRSVEVVQGRVTAPLPEAGRLATFLAGYQAIAYP